MGWVPLAAAAVSAVAGNASRNSAASQASDLAAQNYDRANALRDANITANRADQIGPDGSITFTTGADGQLVKTTTLAPTQQGTYDALTGAQSQLASGVGDTLGKGIDTSGFANWQNVIGPGATNLMTHDWLGSAGNSNGTAVAAAGTQQSTQGSTGPTWNPGGGGGGGSSGGGYSSGGSYSQPATPAAPAVDPYKVRDTFSTDGVTAKLPSTIDSSTRQAVEDALYARLNPQLQRDEQDLRTRLLNSGIEVGTDAYNREMQLQNQKANDARMQVVLAGGQEEDRQTKLLQGLNDQQFQQALATGKFGQDADIAMANNATSRSNAATAAGATMGAAGIAASSAMDRLRLQLDQQSKEFNVNTGFKAAEFNNNMRKDQLAEQILLRSEPLKELAALNQITSGMVPKYDSNYYTNSAALPNTQVASGQQGNVLTDITSGVSGINNLWNMKW